MIIQVWATRKHKSNIHLHKSPIILYGFKTFSKSKVSSKTEGNLLIVTQSKIKKNQKLLTRDCAEYILLFKITIKNQEWDYNVEILVHTNSKHCSNYTKYYSSLLLLKAKKAQKLTALLPAVYIFLCFQSRKCRSHDIGRSLMTLASPVSSDLQCSLSQTHNAS